MKKSEKIKLRPLHDRIVLRKIIVETKTKGGIILSADEDVDNKDVGFGKVIAVGRGKQLDATGPIPMNVKEGDIIAFNDRIPLRQHYRGEYIYILRESDVLYILDDEDVIEKPNESFSTFDKRAKPLI